jgi:hypothetical protein
MRGQEGGDKGASVRGFAGAGILLLMIVSANPVQASSPAPGLPADPWEGWRFLVGGWGGEGSGRPGEGSGSFSFQFDLDRRVLVRRNRAEYPAEGGKPDVVHEDLMVCYPDPSGGRILAIYFDNEGHVIRYKEEIGVPERIVLVSEVNASSPRFRLTYTRLGPGAVGIAFEIAPAGHPDEFVPYITGKAVRSSAR